MVNPKRLLGNAIGYVYGTGQSLFNRHVGMPVLLILSDYLDRKDD